MIHWKETADMLSRLAGLEPARRAALATVVRISGSAEPLAFLAGREPRHLCTRNEALHAG
jgi:hypothetical protein